MGSTHAALGYRPVRFIDGGCAVVTIEGEMLFSDQFVHTNHNPPPAKRSGVVRLEACSRRCRAAARIPEHTRSHARLPDNAAVGL